MSLQLLFRLIFLIPLVMCLSLNLRAQTHTYSGKVLDATNDEPLPSCNIQRSGGQVLSTDAKGYFSFRSKSDQELITISFIGYQTKPIVMRWDQSPVTISLTPQTKTLDEVSIIDKRTVSELQFENIRSGEQVLRKEAVLRLPGMAGEPDFIKALMLMPGATKGIEGSSDIFIRGGSADQNLVMLDGATVYSTGHLFGFLSVFNPSAIGDVSMMTGGFPARYGGRLSSIIDVRSKKLDLQHPHAEGGIGLISSRLAIEVPLVKDKIAMQVAARRTYADQVAKLADIDLPYYFYDINAKIDWQINKNTKAQYGFYMGDDKLDFTQIRNRDRDGDEAGTEMELGNINHTFKFEHRFSKRLIAETNIHFTKFDYDINSFFQDNFINVDSDIEDYGLKQNFIYTLNESDFLHSGFSATKRTVRPNLINSGGELSEVIPSSDGKDRFVWESAVFGEWEFNRGRWQGIVGARLSSAILENKTYINPEPRLALRYGWNEQYALKASYTRMVQYIHRVSSSSFALPTDVWYPVDVDVKPQYADQTTLGLSRIFPDLNLVASTELYYKRMRNLVEFKEGTNLTLNNDFKETLIQGDGESYGIELHLKKDEGKLKGWISYTLSWTNRQFDDINRGKPFPARYDRRHNVAIVTNYDLSNRWAFSAVWEFISGARFTPVIGYYGVPNPAVTGVDLIPIYPERNSISLADAHRLDLSIILRDRVKPNKKWSGEWHFSVYNIYNRATPIGIDLVYDEASDSYFYEQPGLFGLLPSISYNFKF